MASRLNSDKVICGVLEDDCRLSEGESSEKESDSTLVDYRPCRGGKLSNFLTCPLFGIHEREALQEDSLVKIMSHSKSPR